MTQAIKLLTFKLYIMTTTDTLKSIYTSNNETLRMLISLINKWEDKSYDLTDKEWNTIKSYKSLLDLYFNDTTLIQETITANEKTILSL